MARRKIKVGDKVEIICGGWCSGDWGIVVDKDEETCWVAMFGGNDSCLVFEERELKVMKG